MGVAWSIPHAFYHLACILTFIFMIIVIICSFAYNDPTNITFKIMSIIIAIISLIGCIYTGINLKKRKIIYKDDNLSSSTIRK